MAGLIIGFFIGACIYNQIVILKLVLWIFTNYCTEDFSVGFSEDYSKDFPDVYYSKDSPDDFPKNCPLDFSMKCP